MRRLVSTTRRRKADPPENNAEALFVEPVAFEHSDMYLKAVWLTQEGGESPARIASISKILRVAPPSVVQMFRKLEEDDCVMYLSRRGVKLTQKGEGIGSRMVRNMRLMEVLMSEKLGMEVDSRVACGLEHHMTEGFAEALCTLLGHPRRCPHDQMIPEGRCCATSS